MTKRQAIICDLDGTLCDHSRRQLLIPKDPHSPDAQECWEQYHADLRNDPVIEGTRIILENFNRIPNDCWHGELQDVIIVTGRPERYRTETKGWLKDHDIDYDKMYFRDNGDKRPDYVVKKGIYLNAIEPHFDVKLVIDDRISVVKMWRDLGLTCFQPCEGAY